MVADRDSSAAPAVWIVGTASTPFGRFPDRGFKALTADAYGAVLADAGLTDGALIEAAWFGNCGMGAVGQGSIRGQVCITPLVRDGAFPELAPVTNVENACGTGSSAVHGAFTAIAAGQARVALAIGVEKLYAPAGDPAAAAAGFSAGIDMIDPGEWQDYYAAAGAAAGRPFAPGPGRSLFMDTYAMQAAWHMQRYGTTREQIAAAAAKTHNFGADNPLAQYRFRMDAAAVLADREVSWPLTRAMCAPIGDGAAAVLLASGEALADLVPAVRDRAVRIRGIGLAGGRYRRVDEPSLTATAARRAYARAGVAAADIDVAEVHDATSFSELYQSEMMGFCGEGQGGRFIADGGGSLDSSVTINASGGLVSKGHPVGATGCSMMHEVALQLRGEAGPRQRPAARLGLIENGGGAIGFDEAFCAVTILERA